MKKKKDDLEKMQHPKNPYVLDMRGERMQQLLLEPGQIIAKSSIIENEGRRFKIQKIVAVRYEENYVIVSVTGNYLDN